MNEKSHVFEETFREYLKQIAGMNFELLADVLGIYFIRNNFNYA